MAPGSHLPSASLAIDQRRRRWLQRHRASFSTSACILLLIIAVIDCTFGVIVITDASESPDNLINDHKIEQQNVHGDQDHARKHNSYSNSGIDPEEHYNANTNIIDSLPDGSIVIKDQIYKVDFKFHYGYDAAQHLRKIRSNASLLESVRRKQHKTKIQEQAPTEVEIDALYQKYEVSILLIEDLLSLALIHKEEWMQSLLPLQAQVDTDNNDNPENPDFHLAVNCYEATLHFYHNLWEEEFTKTMPEGEGDDMFSTYDREALAAGMTAVYLQLSELFHQHHGQVIEPSTTSIDNDYATAYRYLITSERWCTESLSLLGENSDDEGDGGATNTGPKYSSYENKEYQEDHYLVVNTAKQTCSYTQFRMGTILLDMFAVGYVLDLDDNLHLDTSSSFVQFDIFGYDDGKGKGGDQRINDNQQRILRRSLEKLQKGVKIDYEMGLDGIYEYYSSIYDNQLNVADAHNHMGVAFGYLLDWENALKEWNESLSWYGQIFQDLHENVRDVQVEAECLDIVASMITTTQSLWEAHLHLGNMEEANETFRRHLVLRRFLEFGVSMEEPLDDGNQENEDDEATYYAGNQDDINAVHEGYSTRYGVYNDIDSQHAHGLVDTLGTYRQMLEEYFRERQRYPDDSFYEMEFSYDGSADNQNYIVHDHVYEGSLRAGIGSIHLALNQVWEARNQLELAVGLLREGAIEEGDGTDSLYNFVGENGETISRPIKLDLADALLNLSYAQLGLKRFLKSYQSFEEAMSLYKILLSEGESPLDYSSFAGGSEETKREHHIGLVERLARLFYGNGFNENLEEKMEENGDIQKLDQPKNDALNYFITIDNYQITENITKNQR